VSTDLTARKRTENLGRTSSNILNRAEATSRSANSAARTSVVLSNLNGTLCSLNVSLNTVNLCQFSLVKTATLSLSAVNDIANLHGQVSLEFLLTLQKNQSLVSLSKMD
jgi:hypothetical protein